MNTLTAIFEPCEEGGYHAFFREIPGIHSQGETIMETSDNLVDAFREVLLYRLEEIKDEGSPAQIAVSLAS